MPSVIFEKREKIAYITINRPEAYNALNLETWNGLTEAWKAVSDDPDIWVAIVTSAGEKAFCAGQDLKELHEWMRIPEAERPPVPVPNVTPMRGMEVWKPFIAAVHGICTGGGLELALACDISIAADNARLGLAEVKQALIPGMGGTQRLPRIIPLRKALEMLITGDFIDANEAYRIGLVNSVVPLSDLMPTAEALAVRICENGPLAVRAVKEAAYRGLDMSLSDGIQLEQEIVQRLSETEDLKEGPRAFAEKRKPIYKGK